MGATACKTDAHTFYGLWVIETLRRYEQPPYSLLDQLHETVAEAATERGSGFGRRRGSGRFELATSACIATGECAGARAGTITRWSDRIVIDHGAAYVEAPCDLRRDLGLDRPYGSKAMALELGEGKPLAKSHAESEEDAVEPKEPPAILPDRPGDEDIEPFEAQRVGTPPRSRSTSCRSEAMPDVMTTNLSFPELRQKRPHS